MNNCFGPWATAINTGSNPQLSTFWQRRLTRLPLLSQSSDFPSRPASVVLGLIAVAIFAMPTLHGWAASADPGEKAPARTSAHGDGGPNATKDVHKARSYKYTAVSELALWEDDDSCTVRQTGYWLAGGSERIENTFLRKGKNEPFMATIEIRPAGKPGIFLHQRDKCYHRVPVFRDNFPSPIDDPENAVKLCASAEHQRGTKLIDGKQTRGFVIDVKKIDPDYPATSGFMEIWIDVESKWPVLVHSKIMREAWTVDRVTHFQWNIDLHPKLFDPTPPEGYKDETAALGTMESQPSAEQTGKMAEAFRVYAEANAGHYPAVRYISAAVQHQLAGALGLYDYPPNFKQAGKGRFAGAFEGLKEIQHVETYCPDVAYHGKTVGPNDKDKILLRWRLDDGRYAVLYGDLHDETVTAQRLQVLENR